MDVKKKNTSALPVKVSVACDPKLYVERIRSLLVYGNQTSTCLAQFTTYILTWR